MLAYLLLLCAQNPPRPAIVLQDFEGADYGTWTTAGTAFGKGPAPGTLPGQMHVEGFLGKGLVNSFLGGDGAIGTLTSPVFRIERPHLNFLLGGGRDPEKLALRVLVDGKIVGSASGPNDQPGGSERLAWNTIDLGAHVGKDARIEIIDQATGGWGHINVDQIELSDKARGVVDVVREVTAGRYLHLPVKTGAPSRVMKITDPQGKVLRAFDIELCPATETPSFWAFCDLGAKPAGAVRIVTRLEREDEALAKIIATDEGPARTDWFQEAGRPLMHFTAPRGWLNDPNGLVFDGKNFHLFYQHNPYGWNWGNMHWGHAQSRDLIRWEDKPEALFPRTYGDMAFSGSAIIDAQNTSGWGKEGKAPMVLAYTSTGRGECIAWSLDDGLTWTEFEGNPVVKHNGRDPRLLWHEGTKKWIMAVYDETKGRVIHFHSSPDLKKWTFESEIKDFFECPDLVRFADPASPKGETWILYGADGLYLIGDFDGKRFKARGPKQRLWHGNFYAAQTFSQVPDNRIIQIGWANGIVFPGMPFNQQMAIPVDLKLEKIPTGYRLTALPVKEITEYRQKATRLENEKITGDRVVMSLPNEAHDLEITWKPGNGPTGLVLPDLEIIHDPAAEKLKVGKIDLPVRAGSGSIALRILLDRGSAEVFAADGSFAVSLPRRPVQPAGPLLLRAGNETMELESLSVWPLKPGRIAVKGNVP